MSTLLPPAQKLRVTQTLAKLSLAKLDNHDALIILVPESLSKTQWDTLPDGPKLQNLLQRAKKHGTKKRIRSHLGNDSATSITLAELSNTTDWPESFELLSIARQIASEALQDKPVSLALAVSGFSKAQTAELHKALLLAAFAIDFKMPVFRSSKNKQARLKKITIFGKTPAKLIERASIEAESLNLSRWLTALPANVLDAGNYRKAIRSLAKDNHWQMKFHNEAALKKLGAGAFLAVSQGNARSDAGIVHLKYRPKKVSDAPQLALVGKGIVFDTGGTNLKPFKSMLDMHEDMAGSSVALATMLALSKLKVPFAIDCWLAITENRTSAKAYKSRDIVTAANGTTIEVIHTDAEGRMALADTLALAGKKNPSSSWISRLSLAPAYRRLPIVIAVVSAIATRSTAASLPQDVPVANAFGPSLWTKTSMKSFAHAMQMFCNALSVVAATISKQPDSCNALYRKIRPGSI